MLVCWSGCLCGKPFIGAEWYVKDAGAPGLANTAGAGWVVKTQADRVSFYQNFTMGLLKLKNCAGWHWFKDQDDDPTKIGAEPSETAAQHARSDIRLQSRFDKLSYAS